MAFAQKQDMKMEVEIVTSDDAYDIASFSQRSFYEAFEGQNSKENMDKFMINFSMQVLMDEVTSGNHTFFMVRKQGDVVGYIKLTNFKAPEDGVVDNSIELARIYVDQQVVGHGIGNKLMEKGLQFAKDQNYDEIWLGVWEHNYNAQAFYKKWGFERFGEHVFMLGDDPQIDWLLKRKV
jgi:ribosomal protein S18 acetylase RimI-like enzyme